MAKKQNYEVRIFISFDGAPEVRWETLTPEQQREAGARIAQKMGDGLSSYYRSHPEEYPAFAARWLTPEK